MTITDPVVQWLATPIPKKLWHYTSIAGFQGIISAKKIWATDVRFLNDVEEFVHLRQFAAEVLKELPPDGADGLPGTSQVTQLVNRAFNDGPVSGQNTQIFVASFSTSEDQLSQWRGYSRDTTGVSVGFDLSALRPHDNSDTLVVFAPCIYEEETKRMLVRHSVHKIASGYRALLEDATDQNALKKRIEQIRSENPGMDFGEAVRESNATYQEEMSLRVASYATEMFKDLLQLASLAKNVSFKEEQEWRLVLPVRRDRKLQTLCRKFRSGRNTLIPYLEASLSHVDNLHLPIIDLILGPGSEPMAAKEAARAFLHDLGYLIEPRISEVPFRPF